MASLVVIYVKNPIIVNNNITDCNNNPYAQHIKTTPPPTHSNSIYLSSATKYDG